MLPVVDSVGVAEADGFACEELEFDKVLETGGDLLPPLLDIDVAQVRGTGAGGRVTKEDVLGYLERSPADGDGKSAAAASAPEAGKLLPGAENAGKPGSTAAVITEKAKAQEDPNAQSPEKKEAAQLLKAARAAMNEGNLELAREKAIRARDLKASYSLFEDRPDQLLSEIDTKAAAAGSQGSPKQPVAERAPKVESKLDNPFDDQESAGDESLDVKPPTVVAANTTETGKALRDSSSAAPSRLETPNTRSATPPVNTPPAAVSPQVCSPPATNCTNTSSPVAARLGTGCASPAALGLPSFPKLPSPQQ